MNAKQLFALITLAAAGSAALADDITVVKDNFVAAKSRAEVKAEVLNARAQGTLQVINEVGAPNGQATPVRSTMTRDQVRAELRNAPRTQVVSYNPAA